MKLKVWTLVGTRPEIIRMSQTINLMDRVFEHTLVHTGQNFGESMSQVFFRDLDVRQPDYHMEASGLELGKMLAHLFERFHEILNEGRPDALVVLGDTNSALLVVLAKRLGIPTYHLEAGNRSFDLRVPEEVNRKIVDHCADFNLAYNSYSYQNLISEGLPRNRTFITGSPMLEVLESVREKIKDSQVLSRLGVKEGAYLVGSFHRQENVDSFTRLSQLAEMISFVTEKTGLPMVLSLHPRTMDKLSQFEIDLSGRTVVAEPLGFVDYCSLQESSFGVVSDSGTLAEESALLGFRAVSARESTERTEALNSAHLVLAGLSGKNVLEALQLPEHVLRSSSQALPEGYDVPNFSQRVVNIIISTLRRRDFLLGVQDPHISGM